MSRVIGEIGNYYGNLEVKEEDGKYYWTINDWDQDRWEEIPEYLYETLNDFQDSLEQKENTNEAR